MRILGIDYGRKKIGLATASRSLAEPYEVIRFQSEKEVFEKIDAVVKKEKIETVVVGISEGEMGEESQNFSLNLKEKLSIPVETFDETLSTQEAQRLSQEAGIKRIKRHELEDAYAAAVMLQNYLDSNNKNIL